MQLKSSRNESNCLKMLKKMELLLVILSALFLKYALSCDENGLCYCGVDVVICREATNHVRFIGTAQGRNRSLDLRESYVDEIQVL